MKNYLGLLTGLLIGGIQHYMMTNSKTNSKMRALWGTFKPIAVTLDRFNTPKRV